MFNAEQFALDYNIDFATNGHHYRKGWINISCPFCTGNPGYHGGFNISNGYFNCHRCGSHWLPKVVKELTNLTFGQAQKLIHKYSTGDLKEEYKIDRPDSLILPRDFKPLTKTHWDYLKSRGFSPHVVRDWNLLGSGLHGEYSHRIIAPIYLDGELISFQGRDYTDLSDLKYKACKQENEVFDHQNSIYGMDFIKGDTILIVEGITDAWKIGKGIAGATFGIDWTGSQARLIAQRFKRAFILYDDDPQAVEKALNLYHYLTGRGLECEVLTLNGFQDPGLMGNEDVKKLLKEVGL